jgi:DNA-binding NarL/FixJ family response regulator
MSCLIALAYLNWAPQVHIGSNPAQRIEEIRRLAGRLDDMTQESERAAAEAQMLYAVHVFAVAKLVPDLALSRGREAWQAARSVGERTIEFQAAGSTAMTCAAIGDFDAMSDWLQRAADVASRAPTAHRAWQLETWRMAAAAARGNVEHLTTHFEQALTHASDRSRTASRVETLALFALEAARLGREGQAELIDRAEAAANDALEAFDLLPGHAPWRAEALAALARVRRSRGDLPDAMDAARKAFAFRTDAMSEDAHVEIQVAAAETLLDGGTDEERDDVRRALRLIYSLTAQRTADPEVRARWLAGPQARSITALVGDMELATAAESPATEPLPTDQRQLLQLLAEGRTNREIADSLGLSDDGLAAALATTYATIGVGNAADATAFAYQQIL